MGCATNIIFGQVERINIIFLQLDWGDAHVAIFQRHSRGLLFSTYRRVLLSGHLPQMPNRKKWWLGSKTKNAKTPKRLPCRLLGDYTMADQAHNTNSGQFTMFHEICGQNLKVCMRKCYESIQNCHTHSEISFLFFQVVVVWVLQLV